MLNFICIYVAYLKTVKSSKCPFTNVEIPKGTKSIFLSYQNKLVKINK